MYLILSIICSIILFITLKPYLVSYIKDTPNERSSHNKVVPSGGGLIFVMPLLIYSIISKNLIFLSLIPLVIIGLLDDVFKVGRLIRVCFQVSTICLIINFSNNLNFFSENIQLISYLAIVFCGVSLINFMNFMDGLDGLLSGCMFLIFSRSFYFIYPQISIIIGSLIVFIFFNWSPAKIFMGDIGSTFLGGIYFIILLSSSNFSQLLMNLLIGTPLLMDSFSCLFLRLLNKEDIFSPHKKHLYQRLNQAGISHSNISLIYIISTLLLVVVSTFGNNYYLFFTSFLVITGGLFLNSKYALDFN